MTTIRTLAVVLCVSVLVVMWSQYQRLGSQQNLIELYQDTNEELRTSIETMVHAYADNSRQMQQVLVSQQRIQQNLSTRQTEIRRLQRDVEEIRVWADHPLPDAVIRMRQRPAVTGATNYGSTVPASDTVHIDRIESENER